MASIVDPASDGNTVPLGEPDWGYIASRAKDWHWSELTGMCGGCGNLNCHPDQAVCPCNDEGYCLACPTRRATGEVRGVR